VSVDRDAGAASTTTMHTGCPSVDSPVRRRDLGQPVDMFHVITTSRRAHPPPQSDGGNMTGPTFTWRTRSVRACPLLDRSGPRRARCRDRPPGCELGPHDESTPARHDGCDRAWFETETDTVNSASRASVVEDLLHGIGRRRQAQRGVDRVSPENRMIRYIHVESPSAQACAKVHAASRRPGPVPPSRQTRYHEFVRPAGSGDLPQRFFWASRPERCRRRNPHQGNQRVDVVGATTPSLPQAHKSAASRPILSCRVRAVRRVPGRGAR